MAKPYYAPLAPNGDSTAHLPSPNLFCCLPPLPHGGEAMGDRFIRIGGEEGGAGGVREEAGWLMNNTAAPAAMEGRPPFTASQLEELRVQVLIFKHILMGVPVPPELLLLVRRSLEAMAARLYHHPAYGHCSYFGKKFDPEPGRCRRTDGKKWRCSKDAHPESRYCERHMHRGRNRSRKPVESQPVAPSQSASTVISLAPSGSGGSDSKSIPMRTGAQVPFSGGMNCFQLQPGTGSHETGSKEFRYPYGDKSEAGEHGFFPEVSGSARGVEMDFPLDSSWGLMPSQMPNALGFESNYLQLPAFNDLGQVTVSSLTKQDQSQHSFFGNEFGSEEPVKQSQELRPFFDEWPKTRGPWSDLEDERSNRSSFSTTQLSISIPVTSSDFSTSSSRSPIDD
ncbi:hypothetical protein OPV22_021973 [Ensete ventricosum]|uniref:Growth-regulating factor n=1 Tax=Ensete ventricosum TaxID=4639 RepID=A0AAV8PDM3_ENSVE|nr:hypothetical protein OPV22_021973 [Ensete ventricosum]